MSGEYDKSGEHALDYECSDVFFREFMWHNEKQGFIAFDVKSVKTKEHHYYEYIRYYQPKHQFNDN